MGRLALIAFLCVPLTAQDVRFQAALRDSHDPKTQKALELAGARAGIWVASMSQSQQLLFAPAIVRGSFLNIELRVRNNQECSGTYGPPGKAPVTTCGPSSPETVAEGIDLDIAGPEWRGIVNSRSTSVPDMALSGDRLRFSGTWEKSDFPPTTVPITMDVKFSPDGSQLTGTMICDGKSESVTFERAEDSGTPFGGDWATQDGLLFHIHTFAWSGTHVAASFDQISSGLFGMPVAAYRLGAKLYLRLTAPTTFSRFIGDISADGSSMTGYWSGNSPGGTDFRRIESPPAPQK